MSATKTPMAVMGELRDVPKGRIVIEDGAALTVGEASPVIFAILARTKPEDVADTIVTILMNVLKQQQEPLKAAARLFAVVGQGLQTPRETHAPGHA